jgi:hypothetical protein
MGVGQVDTLQVGDSVLNLSFENPATLVGEVRTQRFRRNQEFDQELRFPFRFSGLLFGQTTDEPALPMRAMVSSAG